MQGIEITKPETAIQKKPDGELTPAGDFIVKKEEKPNGWQETHREALVKIRGEREARRINYADYLKLITFYKNQARLVKDRKHIMVALSTGVLINTADITSLETEDVEHFVPKVPEIPEYLADLPTEWIKFEDPDEPGIICEALCHKGAGPDGITRTYKGHNEIKELRKMRIDENNRPVIVQIYKYGIPQL